MTFWAFIRRSLRFHARAHFGVWLGAAIASTALIGALVVGDSVRGTLRERALQRLANASFVLATGERTFSQELAGFRHLRYSGSRDKYYLVLTSPSESAATARLEPACVPLLSLRGTASRPGGEARANQVQVYGVTREFAAFAGAAPWKDIPKGGVVLNRSLAAQLGARKGDEVLLRVSKPGRVSAEAAVGERGLAGTALRLKVAAVVGAEAGGDLSLSSGGPAPINAFVSLEELAEPLELRGQANVLLCGPVSTLRGVPAQGPPAGPAKYFLYAQRLWQTLLRRAGSAPSPKPAPEPDALRFLAAQLQNHWSLKDLGLKLEYAPEPFGLELRSPRVFLDPAIAEAAGRLAGTNQIPVLTYLANLLSAGTNSTPYSMVTAAGPPYTPATMRDDEILINQWLADDLQARPGDTLRLVSFQPESGASLVEVTNTFRVRGIVPLASRYADKTLMPEFPGIEKAETASDWDAGFPLVYKIRPKYEHYWKEHRGTPKAFITLAAGQKLWANRFGSLTAIRFPTPPGMPTAEHWGRFQSKLLASLEPAAAGLQFQPLRAQVLRGAEESQDFGQLFLGFSFFLIAAALLLMALLFQFALEQRTSEVGLLLAVGFTPKRVRRCFLTEAAVLAVAGSLAGVLGGVAYSKALLWGLATLWRNAVGGASLEFHVSPVTLAMGALAAMLVALLTIWLTLRKLARQPARELLAGEAHLPVSTIRSGWLWLALASGLGAAALVGRTLASADPANAEAFFGAGALLLLAGIGFTAAWLRLLAQGSTAGRLSFGGLAMRGCARRWKRSLAVVALLACGCFVIVALGVFRLEAGQTALKRSSGTGGFAWIGNTTLPVVYDLNSARGREFFGLSPEDTRGLAVVPFRVREGDEASCLNLNRAQRPRLLGVNPELLAGRFTFAQAAKGLDLRKGWELLKAPPRGLQPAQTPRASSDTAPGVRPSSGAATAASQAAPGWPNAPVDSKLAAPEDGRTPGAVSDGAQFPTVGPADGAEVPAIGDANSIRWALGKQVGDTLDYRDERGRVLKLRLVAAVANSVLQGNLLIDEAAFVKHFPHESGYRMFLLDAAPDSAPTVSAALSRALRDVGLELVPATQRLNAFNAVQNTYLGTFQLLGGLGLLLGSAGLGVVVRRNVLERRGELGVLLAVGFRPRAVQRLVLYEHGALLALGLGLGTCAAGVAVLPAALAPGTPLPSISLVLTLGAVLLNGALWTWLATRSVLRANLLESLRNA